MWLVFLGGTIHTDDVGSQTAGIWFRGKFANVLTGVEGSEGNCERAGLKKKHSINWIHIKIRLPGELLDDSNAFKKGVWAGLKKIRPMNLRRLNSPLQKNKSKPQHGICFIQS